MKTRIIGGIFLIAVIAGCSTALVQSDYDREINFTTFHTFDWSTQSINGDSKADKPITLFERRLKKAVDKELTANGFQKQSEEKPDFLITYSIKVKDKANMLYSDYGYGGYGPGYGFFGLGYGFGSYGHHYGYGGYGHYYGYGGYGYHSFGYRPTYYSMGGLNSKVTIILNFVDPETNNIIWSGLYKGEIEENDIILMNENHIINAVKNILKEFPPSKMNSSDRSLSKNESQLALIKTLKQIIGET